eukprot:1714828-Rhodomonas_salina.1
MLQPGGHVMVVTLLSRSGHLVVTRLRQGHVAVMARTRCKNGEKGTVRRSMASRHRRQSHTSVVTLSSRYRHAIVTLLSRYCHVIVVLWSRPKGEEGAVRRSMASSHRRHSHTSVVTLLS